MVKPQQILIIFFTLLISVSPAFAGSVKWNFSFNNTLGTFSAITAGSAQTVTGTVTRPSTGFVRMVVTASSGDNAPAVSSVKYAIEVPGLSFISEPLLLNEQQLIYAVASGTCPVRSFNSTFVFGQWDTTGANDLTSNSQPAFGTASYNLGTGAFTLTNVYNVNNNNPVPAFSSFSMDASNCAGGVATIAGAGDRGGTLYFAYNGASVLRTNGNKAVIGLPQVKIPGRHELNGNYAVYRYDAASVSQITPMRMTISDLGATGASEKLSDPNAGTLDGSFQETLTVNTINSPVNGMFTGTVVNGATNGKVTCAVYFTQQNLIFCAGQSPDLNSKPFNIMLVADVPQFSRPGSMGESIWGLLPIPDGSNDYLAFGEFLSFNGHDSRGLARVNADLTRDSSFTSQGRGFSDLVESVKFAADGSGDIYVAGLFRSYGTNYDVNGLCRLNSDGTLDFGFDTGLGFNRAVLDIEVISGSNDVYAVGNFSLYNGTPYEKIVRLNSDATIDTNFDPGAGFTGEGDGWTGYPIDNDKRGPRRIYKEPGSQKIFVVGDFTNYKGTSVGYIARILSNGNLDTGFNTGTGFNDMTGFVYFIPSGGGSVLVGGAYNGFNGNYGLGYQGLVRLTTSGAQDTTFSLAIDEFDWYGPETITPLLDGTGRFYYAGGDGGRYARVFARIFSDGSVDTSFNVTDGGADLKARAIVALPGGASLWAGDMTEWGDFPLPRAVKLLSNGARDWTWGVASTEGLAGQVWDIVDAETPDGDIYVAANSLSFSGISEYNVYRVNSNGSLDREFSNERKFFEGETRALAVKPDGTLWVAGNYDNFDNVSNHKLMRFDYFGQQDTNFVIGSGIPDGPYGQDIRTIIKDPTVPDKAIIGGWFTSYQGTTANYIARVLPGGPIDSSFNTGTGFDDTVEMIKSAADGTGRIYVGGWFNTFNGNPHAAIVRLNSDGSLDATFNTGTGVHNDAYQTHVQDLAVAKDGSHKVYLAGEVRGSDGHEGPAGLICLNSDGSFNSGFGENLSGSGPGDWEIRAVDTSPDGGVFVGGVRLWEWNGTVAPGALNFVKLKADSSIDTTFDVGNGFNDQVNRIFMTTNGTGKVYVGGSFTTYHNQGAAYLVRLRSDGSLD